MARAARTGRWSLRAKWTLAVLAVAIVPMVVLGLVVLDIQRAGLSRAEKELETAVVDEAARSIIAALDQASDVAGRVTAIVADGAIDGGGRTRMIGDVVGRAPAISGVAFFDTQHQFIDAVVPKGSRDDTLRIGPGGRGFRVAMVPDGPAGALALRFEAPLEGSIRGFIVVGLARDVIADRLRDISQTRFGAPDRVYLVDEKLDVLSGGGGTNRRSLSIFAASGSKAESFATELLLTTEFKDGSVDKVGTIRTMPAQRWAIVVERPTEEAFGALTAARKAFALGVVGAAALALLASLLVVRRVLAPTVEHIADDLATSELEVERRARIEVNLRRYMPAEAAEAAAKGESSLDLGGARKRVTVVFADVVAFTGFAESASPERAVAFLNELFTILSEIVFRHDGMVDKFIGDCIMAVFRPADGASSNDDVARALAAAEDMHAFVQSNLPRWREAYSFDVELGIGVSTGEVLLGNLGSSARMEYTVIGDAVNVAARLEALARPRQTLTTRDVVDACPDLAFTSLGEHPLRGRAKPVEVFEVVT